MTDNIVSNAISCGICGASSDRYSNSFRCQQNSNHIGDLYTGIFTDLTCEETFEEVMDSFPDPDDPEEKAREDAFVEKQMQKLFPNQMPSYVEIEEKIHTSSSLIWIGMALFMLAGTGLYLYLKM